MRVLRIFPAGPTDPRREGGVYDSYGTVHLSDPYYLGVAVIFDLLIWVVVGAVAGALVAAIRFVERDESIGRFKGAIYTTFFAAVGALVGSVIYLTLADTLYRDFPFSL
jgi:uncharacterized membrane protein YeaQ/YmgE (transglycosylase-associated protein family)